VAGVRSVFATLACNLRVAQVAGTDSIAVMRLNCS
jgi:hypothetical protein